MSENMETYELKKLSKCEPTLYLSHILIEGMFFEVSA